MLSIRLARVGRVNLPAFRVVVQQKTRAPRSKVVEILGHYDPKTEPAQVSVNQERLNHWLSRGARPTVAVADLLVKQDLLKLEQAPELVHERELREASKKRVADKKKWQAQVAKEKKKRAESKAKGSGDKAGDKAKDSTDKPTTADTKSADSAKPAEAKSEDAKTKPNDNKPADAKPSDTKPKA